jgi:hypothetical protein
MRTLEIRLEPLTLAFVLIEFDDDAIVRVHSDTTFEGIVAKKKYLETEFTCEDYSPRSLC